MLRAERLEIIRNLAKENEIISWEKLNSYLDASKATIRRDIEQLESEGVARKTRGGVIFPRVKGSEPSNEIRKYHNTDAKGRIAEAALDFISDHDFVMLDSGSTVLELAKRLPKERRIGVVTYYFEAARIVSDNENAEVFLLGGKVRKGFYTCHGFMAEKMLEEFHANVCFLGADGVDVQRGITGYNALDVPLKQIMMKHSDKVILLCDHSKFESNAYMYIAKMDQIDVVITDSETSETDIRTMQEGGIEVIVV